MEAEGFELPSAILAARLLILTGCRLNEMTLKRAYLHLADRVLRLPDSKTGAKIVHLGDSAVELLRDAPRVDGNQWVIIGTPVGQAAERSSALLAALPRPRRRMSAFTTCATLSRPRPLLRVRACR